MNNAKMAPKLSMNPAKQKIQQRSKGSLTMRRIAPTKRSRQVRYKRIYMHRERERKDFLLLALLVAKMDLYQCLYPAGIKRVRILHSRRLTENLTNFSIFLSCIPILNVRKNNI
jgi:hypothetical protein